MYPIKKIIHRVALSMDQLDEEIANEIFHFVVHYQSINGGGCIMQDVLDHLVTLYGTMHSESEIEGLIESALEYMVLHWRCGDRKTLQYNETPLCVGYDPEEFDLYFPLALYN